MSADSLRSGGSSNSIGGKGSQTHHHHRVAATIVRPQPVSEKTLMESVAGLINEVGLVAQPYSTNEEKEGSIVWTKFMGRIGCSVNSSGSSSSASTTSTPANHDLKSGLDSILSTGDCQHSSAPLLLSVGYPSGIQMWAIPLNGEAQEVLSWKRPSTRLFQLLPTPSSPAGREPGKDEFRDVRPVVAFVEGTSNGPNHLTFVSLRSGEILKSMKFIHSICDLLANSAYMVISFLDKIVVIDPFNFETKVSISVACSSTCQTPTVNPIALGASWLAYSDHKLFPTYLSAGGVELSGPPSYTATVLHAAKSLTKGLKGFGETVANSITGHRVPLAAELHSEPTAESGIVTIVNLMEVRSGEFTMSEVSNGFTHLAVVAHFVAHLSNPVVALNFDPSGLLLVTADKGGHDFHVFRIHPHPLGSAMGAVHHLYVLHRGDTGAKVQDISFAPDSRWVAVSTLRGTTHIFPITPYGGGICVRTHTSHRVVNRLSRFHRTAGLDDSPTSGRNSPIISSSPNNPLTTGVKSYDLLHLGSPYPNPRLPPFPHPLIVQPLAQLRQSFIVSSSPKSSPPIGKTKGGSMRGLLPHEERLHVVSTFDAPRGWLVNTPIVQHCDKRKRAPVDAVFVMTCHGNLIEYFLEPISSSSIPKEKVSDDAPIELTVHARAQWSFPRPAFTRELHPPLVPSNILLSAGLPPALPLPINNCNSTSSSTEAHLNSTAETHRSHNIENDENSDEKWLSQVEITTHSGPHRRLWMGPQFTFKIFNPAVTSSGKQTGVVDVETVEVNVTNRPAKSNPVNMPVSSSLLPVVIEGSSGSSLEQSPRLIDPCCESEVTTVGNESQIKENLADAMMENCAVASRNTGGCQSIGSCDDLSSSSFDSISQHSSDTPLVPSFCIEATLNNFPD